MTEEIKQYLKNNLQISLCSTYNSGCRYGQVLEVKLTLDGDEISKDYVSLASLKED